MLTLSSFFSGAVSPILVDMVEKMLPKHGDAEGDYRETMRNSPWALGICMQTLAKRDVSEWNEKVNLVSWTRACLSNWAWSHDVLAGLHALSQPRFVNSVIHPSVIHSPYE